MAAVGMKSNGGRGAAKGLEALLDTNHCETSGLRLPSGQCTAKTKIVPRNGEIVIFLQTNN